jgi:DNA-binding NarL/FixJ family response regulator
MDGLSATREILRNVPTVPIFIYTLHNIPAIELEAKKAGARKMVLKPHVDALIGAMEEILSNESQNSAVVSAPGAASSDTEVNPIAPVAEDVIANKPQGSLAAMSGAIPTTAATTAAAPASESASTSAPPTDGAETKAVAADGDSAAPPAMGDPQLPSS